MTRAEEDRSQEPKSEPVQKRKEGKSEDGV